MEHSEWKKTYFNKAIHIKIILLIATFLLALFPSSYSGKLELLSRRLFHFSKGTIIGSLLRLFKKFGIM